MEAESVPANEAVLEMRDLYVGYYRDLNILQGLNVTAHRHQITAVLGANGVGKSTALRAASGFLKPNSGDIRLENESILRRAAPPADPQGAGLPGQIFVLLRVASERSMARDGCSS